jgi:hypothetical protein
MLISGPTGFSCLDTLEKKNIMLLLVEQEWIE